MFTYRVSAGLNRGLSGRGYLWPSAFRVNARARWAALLIAAWLVGGGCAADASSYGGENDEKVLELPGDLVDRLEQLYRNNLSDFTVNPDGDVAATMYNQDDELRSAFKLSAVCKGLVASTQTANPKRYRRDNATHYWTTPYTPDPSPSSDWRPTCPDALQGQKCAGFNAISGELLDCFCAKASNPTERRWACHGPLSSRAKASSCSSDY